MEELKPSFLKSLHERSCMRKDPRSETPPNILFKKSFSNVGMPDSSTILCLISGGVHADSGLWLKAMKTDGKANTQICTHESPQPLIRHHIQEAKFVSAGLIGLALSLKSAEQLCEKTFVSSNFK